MAYMSLYRKWRPQTFADVVGQNHAVQTIKNALDHDRLSHAYLFCGPRGVGKTTVARLIAKGLNCAQGPTSSPCNQCIACDRITKGLSMDVIEIDAASNRGIDEIRDLRDKVRFAPTEGKYKVYIIDEVHMLTTDAFNALLKTLEEPPEHVVFILATTEPHKIPATILSRCQRFDFRSLTNDEMAQRLSYVAAQEGISVTDQALVLIAKHAAGGMRDALGLLDQCSAYSEGKVDVTVVADALGIVAQDQVWKFAALLAGGKPGPCIEMLQEIAFAGKDLRQFAKDCAEVFRAILLAKLEPSSLGVDENFSPALEAVRDALSIERLVELLEHFGKLDNEIRVAADERIPFELGIIRMTSSLAERSQSGEGRSDEIRKLRRQLQQLSVTVQDLQNRLEMLSGKHGVGMVALQRNVGLPSASTADEGQFNDGHSTDDNTSHSLLETDSQDKQKNRSVSQVPNSVSAIGDIWNSIFEVLRQERQASLGAFLREAQPAAVTTDGRLILAFPPDRGFHKASVEQPKMKETLERVIARLTGKRYVVQCEFGAPQEVAARYQKDGEVLKEHGGKRDLSQSEERNTSKRKAADVLLQAEPESEAVMDASSDAASEEHESATNDPIVRAALDIFKGKLIRLK